MDTIAFSNKTIYPERLYNASQAARKLGIHRCTLYKYIRRFPNRLNAMRTENKSGLLFKGKQLIEFKETGFPKRGRKKCQS